MSFEFLREYSFIYPCKETPPGSSASVLKSSILPDQTIIKNNINTTTTNNHDTIARSATAAGGGGGGDYFDHLVEPIETSQQFFKWFSDIEKEMEKGQEDIYRYIRVKLHLSFIVVLIFSLSHIGRAYLASIVHYRDACSDVLTVVGGTSELLDNLMEKYRFVENKSKALQNACEELLSEQVRSRYWVNEESKPPHSTHPPASIIDSPHQYCRGIDFKT